MRIRYKKRATAPRRRYFACRIACKDYNAYLCSAMEDRYRKYLKLIFPALFIVYLGCIMAFTHVHIVNGVTIVHAHPYHSAANGQGGHEHSLTIFQLLHQLSVIQLAGGAWTVFAFHLFLAFCCKHACYPVYPAYLRPVRGCISLRAPPLF